MSGRKTAGAILVLAALLVLFFFDVLFQGKTLSTSTLLPGATPNGPYGFGGYRPPAPFSFDTAGNAWVNEPQPYLVRQAVEKGEAPVWNPREGLGMPLVGNLNSEVFNPLKAFLNLFPSPFLQDIFFILRLFVTGLFTFLFLREMRLSRFSALFGASFFMLSGYSLWWINLHPLSTVMYFPAVFYFYERSWNRGEMKSRFLMALSLGFGLVSGKVPEVIMGFSLLLAYALWKGFRSASVRGLLGEGLRVCAVSLSGILMASVALLPFFELYAHASPLAKAIRTGAASHTLPLVSSLSLWEPLFFGWKDYFYRSWYAWPIQVMVPYAGAVILLLFLFALFQRVLFLKNLPFFLFSFFLFSISFGILPAHLLARLPLFGSIEFLKYNAMLYLSLAVISAHAFEQLLSEGKDRKTFLLSAGVLSLILLAYFAALSRGAQPQIVSSMKAVLLTCLSGVVFEALVFCFAGSRRTFGAALFLILLIELFLYMPKDRPDRFYPYKKPPGPAMLSAPDRITGDGGSVPPLVSNALGLYDIRAVSVLLPNDYYLFSESLLGFSIPGTNNPNPLFSATSPFTDLLGVKYVLSREPLEHWSLKNEVRSHVASLRWVRFFEAMVRHTIKGGAGYGFFDPGGEARFSLFFRGRFTFETRLRVTEPFLFAGFALKDAPKGVSTKLKIAVGKETAELETAEGRWQDRWLDVSPYIGKVITVVVTAESSGDGTIAMGTFGLSPGQEEEAALYERLLMLHRRELTFLKYKGMYGGAYVYENSNVMDRAFVVHRAETSSGLRSIIKELEAGLDFREVGLVSDITKETEEKMKHVFSGTADGGVRGGDRVAVKEYGFDEVVLDVETRGGLLVLSDLSYPGWKVRVNGREETPVKAFGVLRGVVVNGGKSEVVFFYRPVSLYAGGLLSLAAFIGWIAFLYRKGRRKDRLRTVV